MIDKQLCDKYLAENWDSAVWSPSRIGTFYKCPYSFYLGYVVGERTNNYLGYSGSSVHQSVEGYYKYLLAGRDMNWSIDTLRSILWHRYVILLERKMRSNPVPLPPPHILNGYRNNIKTNFNHWQPIDGVTQVERTITFELGGYTIQGILDAEVGDEYHIDYKSKYSKEYREQQFLYLYAKEIDSGIPPKGFLIPQYKQRWETVWVDYNKDMIDYVLRWVIKGITDIRSALERGKFEVTPPSNFWCNSLCRQRLCEYSSAI